MESQGDHEEHDTGWSVDDNKQPDPPAQLLQVLTDSDFVGWGNSLRDEVVRVCFPPEHVLGKIKDALAGHAQLQRSSDTIQAAIGNGTGNTDEVQHALAANAEAMANIREFLDGCLESFPTKMRPTAQSHVKAEQVFSTAELLEAILLQLSARELLGAMGINHATMQIFKDSPKLLDTLQLRAHKEGNFSNIISDNFDGVRVILDSVAAVEQLRAQWHSPTYYQVPIIVGVLKHSNIQIGERCRAMLIINPPVVSMKVSVSCCPPQMGSAIYFDIDGWGTREQAFISFDFPSRPVGSQDEYNEEENEESEAPDTDGGEDDEAEEDEEVLNAAVVQTLRLRCQTGITVGHIHDAVRRLRKAHVNCPRATVREHAEDGTVKPSITFTALLDLKTDDPYLFEKEATVVRRQLEKLDSKNKEGIMQVFVDSKKRAFERQWPILTFKEFNTKYDVDQTVSCGGWGGNGGWSSGSQQGGGWT